MSFFREQWLEPWCSWCMDSGVVPGAQDSEHACPECCTHPEPLMRPPGPGYVCEACLDWFPSRMAVEGSRAANAANRPGGQAAWIPAEVLR